MKTDREKDMIKQAFGKLTPSKEEQEQIWVKIDERLIKEQREEEITEEIGKKQRNKKIQEQSVKEERQAKEKSLWNMISRVTGTAAAVLAVFMMFYLCADAATNGKVTEALQRITGKEQAQERKKAETKEKEEDVKRETLKITQKMAVYAPEIYACTEKYLVFAHLRGMIIYDREEASVVSAVDLQEINCNHFDSESRFTRIMEKDGELIIYNEKNGVAEDVYYACSLSGDVEKRCANTEEKKRDLCSSWEKYEKSHYVDTFDSLPRFVDTIDGVAIHRYLNEKVMYSENSFGWEGEDVSPRQSTLVVEYDKKKEDWRESANYALLTLDKETKEYKKEELKIKLTLEETEEDYLPRFLYTGEDEQMAAICEMMYQKFNDSGDSGENISSVFIPEPVILGCIEEDGEQIVFAKLNYDFFIKNGNVLEDYGGARLSARLRMVRTKEGMKVEKCELAGDGAKNMQDINRFTKNYPKIREAYYDFEAIEMKQGQVLEEMLQMYREETGLAIAYYKYYGWDKKKIPD